MPSHAEHTDNLAGRTSPGVVPILHTLDLPVQGMTCASCAARIEKKLNRMDGVQAYVNYATGTAHVEYPAELDPAEIVATVERTGYKAELPPPPAPEGQAPDGDSGGAGDDEVDPETTSLRQRLVVGALLSLPVLLLAMVPQLRFDNWQWISLTLASPVAVWAAWPFHRAAAVNARHGATTMDTLISVGVTAAYLWSLYALLFTPTGRTGWGVGGMPSADAGSPELYLEVAAVVTVLVLAGHYAEARARRRSGAALRALLRLGARRAALLRVAPDGTRTEEDVPVARLVVGDLFAVRPGGTVPTDGVVVEGHSAVDTSLVTGEPMPVEVGPGTAVIGGTVNTSGLLVVRATRVGADTTLARIGRLVTQAQNGKAPVQRLADRVSAVFVPIVLALALGTLVVWLVTGRRRRGADGVRGRARHRLPVRARPRDPHGVARRHRAGRAARHPDQEPRGAREHAPGRHRAARQDRHRDGGTDGARRRGAGTGPTAGIFCCDCAAAVEAGSEHPVAQALASAARGLELPAVSGFRSTGGLGVEGRSRACRSWSAARPGWTSAACPCRRRSNRLSPLPQDAGRTAVLAGWDGSRPGRAGRGRHREADVARMRSPRCARSGCGRCC